MPVRPAHHPRNAQRRAVARCGGSRLSRSARRSDDGGGKLWRTPATVAGHERPDPGGTRRRTRRQRAFDLRLGNRRSEEHTSELQSLMRISYAVFCLKKKKRTKTKLTTNRAQISQHNLHQKNTCIKKINND